MEVEFRNLIVTIADISSPKEAYNALCQGLAGIESITGTNVEWWSDTYEVRDDSHEVVESGDTTALFPKVD